MPTYEAELSDGRVVTVQADKPPSESDILAAIGKQNAPAAAALTPEGLPRFSPTADLAPPTQEDTEFAQSQAHPLTTPIAKIIPKISEEVMGKAASFLPSIARERYEAIPETRTSPDEPLTPSLKEKALYALAGAAPSDKAISIATGVQNAGADIGNFFTSPLGIATLGIGALPKAAQSAVALGFAASMAKDVPEIATELGKELGKPEDQRDYKKIAELTANAVANTGFAALGAAHGAGKPMAEKLGAYPSESVTPTVTNEKGTENAIPLGKSEEAVVGQTPGDSSQVGERVPGTEEPANAQGAAQATPQTPQDVPNEVADKTDINPIAVAGPKNLKYRPAIKLANGEVKTGTATDGHDELEEKYGKGERGYLGSDGNYYGSILDVVRKQWESANQSAGRGLAGDVRAKWASATADDEPFGSESGFINLDPLKDLVGGIGRGVRASIEAVRAAGAEAFDPKKMNDYRRSVLNWSAKLQRSYGEASDAQKEIMSKVPDPVRREGITNWIQADGDAATLRARATATTDPKLKRGYDAALTLTPEEIAVARDVKAAYDALLNRGMLYDVIKSFKDNYVTQIWDLKKNFLGNATRSLKDKFQFSKASTFANYFEGEQAGYTPKTKDISKILPLYLHEMNSVIAARQLVAELSRGVASDGRPLVVPRGAGIPVDNAGNKATLIVPKAVKGDTTRDYKVLPNQPAFNDWRWAAKDDAGNPIFLKSDLALHPEAFNRLKNVLGRSAIREWYNTPTSAMAAIPKAIVKGLDVAQSQTKRTMLGLFAPFHQVQEGTHALGHRVSPFSNIPKIDLVGHAGQMDAAKHGLMLLPDRASAEQFMEGFKISGLVSRIPWIGKAADWYSNYLFHEYIPGLKYKTYQAILERNNKVFANDLAAGTVKAEDVKVLSAEQTNAAYGHLNYSDLGRNPTIQHVMQAGLLAPDFLEARGRFAAQALKGLTTAKVGREQVLAVATLAVSQMVAAYVGAKLTGGDWDMKRPFEFRNGNRTWTMRSVPEDAFRLVTDTRSFIYNRVNPLTGKGPLQLLTGTDWRGQKVTAGETLKELAKQPVPLLLRGVLGLNHTPLSWWEQTLNSAGVKVSRYSPSGDIYQKVQEFKRDSKDPKLVAEYERDRKTVNAESDYKPLRDALSKNDLAGAQKEYEKLLETKKPDLILKTMRPYTSHIVPGTDYYEQRNKPFTGSQKYESKFKASLNEEEKALYQKALDERRETFQRFRRMLNERRAKKSQ